MLRRTLGGYARHANFAAVLVVGLGCETNQIQGLIAQEGLPKARALHTFNIQDTGGTREDGGARRRAGAGAAAEKPTASSASRCRPATSRSACSAAARDGYSGISANPALGAAVDRLVRHGGTAILSETPEIYGGEHLLTRRAVSPAVADKLLARIRWWEHYTARNDARDGQQPVGRQQGRRADHHPREDRWAPIAKSGTTNLVDVVEYAEPVTATGLVYMDTPGYDPVSATGQVAGGANLICFTTGRGSAYGCAPSPSLKLSTNTALWRKQQDDIDIDCGGIVDGRETRRRGRRAHLPADAGHRVGRARPRANCTATGRTSSCPGSSAR